MGTLLLMLNKHLLISPVVTFPGETGEEVGTEMEKVSERAETKGEETGGAVELPAAI